MASHRELMIDWNMLDNDCNNWTLQDLQLAAELGRTLLERNEELETELKHQQVVIDDQAQEIEFLTKQVNSMKEESANRSKIYEQLESSICELEKTNSQLSRKHEVDKKRIQSLSENIEYLERKCEELNGTLQSMKSDHGKKSGNGKVNRSTYFSFGSDSSEEEMSSGFGLFRKRSHSLQDLRDYTPSPDEFDSGNSNSPDLKTSETEFIDSLENRIEELITSRNKENDKVRQLETKIQILVQENANLQQQIVQLSNERDEEVSELRKYLRDSSAYGSNNNLNSSFSIPLTSTRRNSDSNSSTGRGNGDPFNTSADAAIPMPNGSSTVGFGSSITLSSFNRSTSSICKRCAAEVQILNLVNSIENDGNLYDWEFGNPDDDMEFSSLEHELAKATGTPYRKDNRFSDEFNFGVQASNFQEVPNRRSSLESDQCNRDSNSTPVTKEGQIGKVRGYLRTHPDRIDVDDMDYDSTEIFDIFFGDKDKDGDNVLKTRAHSPTKVRFSDVVDGSNDHNSGEDTSSGPLSSEDEMGSCDDVRMDEDPCLIKDRKPEFSKNKSKSKSKSSGQTVPFSEGIATSSNGCANNRFEITEPKDKHPKFLQLPKQIPSDFENEDKDSSAVGIRESNDVGITQEVDVLGEHKPHEEETSSKLLCQNVSGFDEDDNISECSEASETGTMSTSISSTSTISIPETSTGSLSSSSSSPPMPEYKQILSSLFSIFNNSKRKYPIPMYPFIQEARRQSGGLIHRHSHSHSNFERNQ